MQVIVPPAPLRLGRATFEPGHPVVMAIVNRTPDSFYDRGATYGRSEALERVDQVRGRGRGHRRHRRREGRARRRRRRGRGAAPHRRFVAAVRERHPDLVISIDTWRAEVADALCERGADLRQRRLGRRRPAAVADVAAKHGAGLVCSHTGGLEPRTDPHRVRYDDVVADVVAGTAELAERAVALGVRRDGILLDPTHDFGKNTAHSLEITRRLDELVATGWPVLVALSNKDFVGETLDLPVEQRLTGTLASDRGRRLARAPGCSAPTRSPRPGRWWTWSPSIRGDRPPAAARRGL